MDRDVAELCYRHPVRLARAMGYDLLREGLHDSWIRELAFGQGDMTLQGHRGSYKTTCLVVALWLVVVTQPGRTVGFLRKASNDVEQVMESVARLLGHGITAELSTAIYGRPLAVTEATSTTVSTDLCCNVSGEPQVSGYGIGGSLTGKHYDSIYTQHLHRRHRDAARPRVEGRARGDQAGIQRASERPEQGRAHSQHRHAVAPAGRLRPHARAGEVACGDHGPHIRRGSRRPQEAHDAEPVCG